MRETLILILSILLLTECADNNRSINPPITKKVEGDSSQANLRGPIDIKFCIKTPSISGKVATLDDVAKGIAVFSVQDGGPEHTVYPSQLPKLAYLIDSETSYKELVVVIQIENTSKGVITGYRKLTGGEGGCFLHELIFLDEQEIKKVSGQ